MSAETYLLDLTIAQPLVTFSRRGQRIDYWRWSKWNWGSAGSPCRRLDFDGWRGEYREEDLGHQQMFCFHCFLMGKTFFLFLFYREEANKRVENRRETGQSKFLEEIGEVAVQLADQPWLEGTHHQSMTTRGKGWRWHRQMCTWEQLLSVFFLGDIK